MDKLPYGLRLRALVAAIVLLNGCANPGEPQSALRLEESTLEIRSLETRTLEAPSEASILSATVAVLQDMEFNIDVIEKPLGVISASKLSDADDPGEQTALVLLGLLCAAGGGHDCGDGLSMAKDSQKLILTMVVRPSLARSADFSVRVSMQRVIYDKLGRVRKMERIEVTEPYEEVFNNLRQALYLEVNQS